MREIKFRALKDDISNCNFVYGHLVKLQTGIPRITTNNGKTFHTCLPKTEGQYTGLKDKNEKDIYEGDIVIYGYDVVNEVGDPSYFLSRGIVKWEQSTCSWVLSKPKRKQLDKSQDAYLSKCGYKVLRITDKEIKNEIGKVYENISTAIQ